MKFLKSIWEKRRVGSFFGSTRYELRQFMSGIGNAEIKENSIQINNYPFEPSFAYPNKEIHLEDIEEFHLDNYPPTIKIKNNLIFVSRELVEKLRTFAETNKIKLAKREANWNFITEPFLDTEFDEIQKETTKNLLLKNGLSAEEIINLRREIGNQMYKYNFDTMIWEWGILGLHDVLFAMRPSLKKYEFVKFYWRAIEIEQRTK